MGDNIIPFGKYKGQEIDQVAARDPQYLQWLTQQGWFVEKFQQLVVNINNFGAVPEETPAHNAMQAKFLDIAFRRAVALAIRFSREIDEDVHFERVADVLFSGIAVEIKPSLGDDYPAVLRQMRNQRRGPEAYFARVWILLVGEYTGTGATLEQVRQVFAASGIKVVLAAEIEAKLNSTVSHETEERDP